ncbi:DNA-binding MarR family transcriptional regulator [Pedobacter sp. W3I1]|uniref:MarR family winged helix-turn-helix transcriptional regulator n=1 Tax=Pedobacter sp. W3I1 TaxID=3042291 RepID=UPI0027893199|nr:MarR family transcriptional regulator [Pedobacter sp. W3I1]MDQ0638890.1 DNA-binding MarR family transcriptional regulator [Pedobacter sp. W3I1]
MKDKKQHSNIATLGRLNSDTTIQMHEAIARKAGLSGTDHKYLGYIIQKGTMTAGEMANLTGLSTGAVTGLVDRFEKKRLVKREFDPADRRKIIVVPNVPNIMALSGGVFDEIQTRMTALMENFNDEEVQIIEKYMTSCIEIMQDITSKLNEK